MNGWCDCTGLDKRLLIFSYPSVLTYVVGAQKNRLIETVLLSTHRSSRACSFGSQTMREFSEPVSRNRLGQGHR